MQEAEFKKALATMWKKWEQVHNPRLSKYAYQVVTLYCKISPLVLVDENRPSKPRKTYSARKYDKQLLYATSFQRQNMTLESRIMLEKEKIERLELTIARMKNKTGSNAHTQPKLFKSTSESEQKERNEVRRRKREERYMDKRMGSNISSRCFCG